MSDEILASQDDPFVPYSLRFLAEEADNVPTPAPGPASQDRVKTVRALRAKAAIGVPRREDHRVRAVLRALLGANQAVVLLLLERSHLRR